MLNSSGNFTCTEDGTALPPSPAAVDLNTTAMMQSMGMSQACSEYQRQDGSAFQASASVGFMFWGGGAGTSLTENNSNASAYGCGNFALDAKKVADHTNNIGCTLLKTAATTSMAASSNARVTIKVATYDPAYAAGLQQRVSSLQADIYNLNKTMLLTPGVDPVAMRSVIEMNQRLLAAASEDMRNYGSIRISGSTIRAKADTRIRQLSNNASGVAQQVAGDYQAIAKQVAEMEIKRTMGFQAVDGNVRQAINSMVDSSFNQMINNISKVINDTTVDMQSSSQIVITAPTNVTITDSVIDANVLLGIAVTSIVNSAVQAGQEVARKLSLDQVGTMASETKTAGADDMQKQLNVAHDTAKSAVSTDWNSILMGLAPLLAIGAVCLIVFAVISRSGGDKSSDTSQDNDDEDAVTGRYDASQENNEEYDK